MKPISADLVGLKFDPVPFSWTSKDVMLYALGVGATPERELEFVFEGKGPRVLPTYAVIPGMLGAGRGSIINNASRIAIQGLGGFSAYSASKGALLSLTRSMAVEYAEKGIRVNAIAPGLVVTAMGESLMRPYVTGEKPIWERAPLGRLGKPEDIAYGVLYLASDESTWVTGVTLVIDGGRSIL